MSLAALSRTLRHTMRVELVIAEMKFKLGARRAVFIFVAAAAAMPGFVMLNVAGYEWLKSLWGPVLTPLLIGVADFVLAAVAVLIAIAARHGPEFNMALDVRKSLTDQLDEELRGTFPFGSRLPGASEIGMARLLVPAVGIILGALRRKPSARPKNS